MGDKSFLCNACGHWAPDGLFVEDEDGVWWVHEDPACMEGAVPVPDYEVPDG